MWAPTRTACAVLLAGVSGCLMTADESRWHDLGREASDPDIALADALVPIDSPAPDARLDSDSAVVVDLGADTLPDGPTPLDVGSPDMSCPQVVLNISGPADDGIIWDKLYVDGSPEHEIWVGFWDGMSDWGYFRFALTQPIAKGATIVNATLDLWGVDADGWNGSSHALEVWLEKAADPAVVTVETDAPLTSTGRPVTSSAKRWPAVGGLPWASGAYNTSPDLAALVQEVVNSQGGLAKGSHLQLWVRGSQQAQADLSTPDYKRPGYVGNPARLTLSWCQ